MKPLPDPKSVDFGSLILAIIAAVGVLTYAIMDLYAQLKGLPRLQIDPTVFGVAIGIIGHYFGRATKGITVSGKTYADPFSDDAVSESGTASGAETVSASEMPVQEQTDPFNAA